MKINLFYLTFSLPALIIAIVYFTFGIFFERGMFGEGQNCYYHMIFSDVLASLCLTVGMIGVYYFIVKILPGKVFYVAWSISENITSVYFIHWVLVSFVVNLCMYVIRGTTLLTPWQVVGLGTLISIAAIVIAHYVTILTGRRKNHAKVS